MSKTLFFFAIVAVLVLTRGNPTQDEDEGDLDQIVGGFTAGSNQFPFTVLFKWSDNSNFCSGSLVRTNKVLTSAWCAAKMRNNRVIAVLRTLTPNPDVNAIRRNVARVVIHPSYSPQTTMNDLAVITLDFPVTNVAPISLGFNINNLNGLVALAIGWGSNVQPGTTSLLRYAPVSVVSPSTCGTYFGNSFYTSGANTICLQSNNVASCTVDAGGPIISQSGFLIGVSSYSNCAIGRPIVAVRIQNPNYQNFILSNI